MRRVAVDIGGTFTDVVLFEDGRGLRYTKLFSRPDDLAGCLVEGIRKLGLEIAEVDSLFHGTTIVANSLLERKTAKVGLLTTRGFRDVLEIMRSNNLVMYDLYQRKPAPLVPRSLIGELDERVDAAGHVLVELRAEDVRENVGRLLQMGVTALAVCLLHAYVNPRHEVMVKEMVTREYPGLTVSISSEVAPEWREFERTSTTVINAAVMPRVESYFHDLLGRLTRGGLRREPWIMQSNGGVTTIRDAASIPVRTFLSGPVGGAMATARLAKMLRLPRVVSFDMGGTSTDVSLILDGEPRMAMDSRFDHWPILSPMVEIKVIGAGGGSIVFVDETGAFNVGPRSAGAVPGPICYANGGTEPTVTDANVALRRIDAQYFLGGEVKVDDASAVDAFRRLGGRLQMTAAEVAGGAIAVVNNNMAQAVRELTIERGYDVREFALIPFGGNGPLHACAVARELGMSTVVIPRLPGNFSAFGILQAEQRHDFVKMRIFDAKSASADAVNELLDALFGEAQQRLAASGANLSEMIAEWSVEARYAGQMYTIPVPMKYPVQDIGELTRRFDDLHLTLNGYRVEGATVEIVGARVSFRVPSGFLGVEPLPSRSGGESGAHARKGERDVFFLESGSLVRCEIYERDRLGSDDGIRGPAVVEEVSCTTLLGPGDSLTVDGFGNLVIEVGRN